MERIPFSQRVAEMPVKKIKMWNLILAFGLSILFSMVLTSVVIADKFQLFKVSSSALKWTATGLILFIIVGIASMKKISKWIKKLEYSDFRQFILFYCFLNSAYNFNHYCWTVKKSLNTNNGLHRVHNSIVCGG